MLPVGPLSEGCVCMSEFYCVKLRASAHLFTLISPVTPHSTPKAGRKKRRDRGRKRAREGRKERGREEEHSKRITTHWSGPPTVHRMVQNRSSLYISRATRSQSPWMPGSFVFPWPCSHSLSSSVFPSPSLCLISLVLPVVKP